MKPESQRIAIAELHLGLKPIPGEKASACGHLIMLTSDLSNTAFCPDYLNDLNAMMQVLATFKNGDVAPFVKALDEVLRRTKNINGTWEIYCATTEEDVCYRIFPFINATAAELAEAYLQYTNLWNPDA